jgi:hypothetical protein
VYPPITIVKIDSNYELNKIHASHLWMSMLATLGAFIDCGNKLDCQMGASILIRVKIIHNSVPHSTKPNSIKLFKKSIYKRKPKKNLFNIGFIISKRAKGSFDVV